MGKKSLWQDDNISGQKEGFSLNQQSGKHVFHESISTNQ